MMRAGRWLAALSMVPVLLGGASQAHGVVWDLSPEKTWVTGAAHAANVSGLILAPQGEMVGRNNLVAGSAGGTWSTPPAPASSLHVNAYLGATRFYAAGYRGANAVAANVEAGHIWAGHETMGNLTQTVHYTPVSGQLGEVDRHATWVGMHIGGRNGGATQGNWQTGMADQVQLWSGAIATGWNPPAYASSFSMNTNSFLYPYVTFFQTGVSGRTADVVNSSWGAYDPGDPTLQSGFNYIAAALDALANANPRTTFVAAAGNSGPSANTVGSPGAGHNVIAVAALTSDTSSPPYNSAASFSSRGPSPYQDPVNGTVSGVRATVDIAAPGTNLTAAYYGGQTGGNGAGLTGSPSGSLGGPNFYTGQLQGTSFAAPIVAGGVALLDDAAYGVFPANPNARDARVIKAVLLNSADKTNGWNNGQTLVSGVITTTQSLDWATGAGRMNLDRAFDQYLPSSVGGMAGTTDLAGLAGGIVAAIGWDYGQVAQGLPNDYYLPTLEGGTTFTVTLDWFRDRTLVGTSVYDDSFDDLDLQIWDVLGGVPNNLIAQSISTYNNVEHLYFTLPDTGDYMIRVNWFQEVFDLVSDANQEFYGLAWWGTAAESGPIIPEPSSLVLIGIGLFFWLAGFRLRRSRRPAAPGVGP